MLLLRTIAELVSFGIYSILRKTEIGNECRKSWSSGYGL